MSGEKDGEVECPSIVAADPRARAWVLGSSLIVLLAGVAFVGWLRGYQSQLVALAAVDRPAALAKAVQLFDALAWICGVPLGVLAAWFAFLAQRINRGGCYPPPGTRVIRDTPLRTGSAARTMARVAGIAALFCVLSGVAIVWMIRAVARVLFSM